MAAGGHRRVPRALATLALGILLGVGVLLAWLRARPEAGAAGPKRLAVLPFENLGRPEDEYFADGVTDEVRGKLTALPGLEVIARTSSSPVQADHKSPQQIGRELGVRVSPDRHRAVGEGKGRRDEPGARESRTGPGLDGFGQVASTLRGPAHRRVPGAGANRRPSGRGARRGARRGRARATRASGPTQNLAAYDAFLRGEEAGDGLPPRTPRRSGGRATITSGRWPWTRASPSPGLSSRGRTRSSIGAPRPLRRQWPLDGPPSGRWRSRPRRADGYLALGNYYEMVRYDAPRALEQYTKGRQLAPKDARLLAWAGWAEFLLGRADEGIAAHARGGGARSAIASKLRMHSRGHCSARRRYAEALCHG